MLILAGMTEGGELHKMRIAGQSIRALRHNIDKTIHYAKERLVFDTILEAVRSTKVFRLPNQKSVHVVHIPYGHKWYRIDAKNKKWETYKGDHYAANFSTLGRNTNI